MFRVLSLCLAAVSLYAASADITPCSLVITNHSYILQSGFVQAEVDFVNPAITFRGDFTGAGSYGTPTGVFSLQTITSTRKSKGTDPRHALLESLHMEKGLYATVTVLQNTSDIVSILLTGVSDSLGVASENWTVTVERTRRHAVVATRGAVVRTGAQAKAVVHSLAMPLKSIFAFYQQGVVQMLNANSGRDYFGSRDYVHRIYGMGGGGALDVQPADQSHILATVLHSSSSIGAQFVLAGAYSALDKWGPGWVNEQTLTLTNVTWLASYAIGPNDRNFPSNSVPIGNNLPERDLEAFLTGVYGSAAGCLSTYPNTATDGSNTPLTAHVAFSAPTLNHPARSYTGNYNFFDPDNFITLSALIYSGDPYLQDQARQVIEQNGRYMLPDGQMLHHFSGLTPVYIALAGVKQTGPNIFWTKAALQYATATGNTTWLRENIASLRQSVAFCTGLIEEDTGLLYAPGSLMIDCFLRENYTTDSNAMMPAFARQFADIEQFVGNTSGAQALRAIADRMVQAVNSGPFSLWDEDSGDHYITNRNLDKTKRDFVDYDANLIAVANGVAPNDWATKILKRVDRGKCTHSRATFVSEIWYGPADTLPIGNTGDSWTSMGRIAWFDAHARRRMGDQNTFDTLILDPILNDVVEYTWVTERFGCDNNGRPTDPGGSRNRSSNFFEFPSVGAMLLREIRYGINLGLDTVSVSPFGPTSFSYHIGNVNLDFSATNTTICVPGSGESLYTYTVGPLVASSAYAIALQGLCTPDGTDSKVQSDIQGVVTFHAPAGASCCVNLAKIQ